MPALQCKGYDGKKIHNRNRFKNLVEYGPTCTTLYSQVLQEMVVCGYRACTHKLHNSVTLLQRSMISYVGYQDDGRGNNHWGRGLINAFFQFENIL